MIGGDVLIRQYLLRIEIRHGAIAARHEELTDARDLLAIELALHQRGVLNHKADLRGVGVFLEQLRPPVIEDWGQ